MTRATDDALSAAREYLYLPEPRHLLFSMAVAVSARMSGDPLWGLVVGPPSSGKTEAVHAVGDVAAAHVDELTPAALMTWIGSPTKGRASGLLMRVGPEAFVTVGDLSTVLATSDRGGRDQLFALLRRVYDGSVVRELGSAPHPLVWEGRLTLLAAVTPSIDNYASHTDALGPRWLYCRLPAMDRETRRRMTGRAMDAEMLAESRDRLRAAVSTAVRQAVPPAARVVLGDEAQEALADAALVACLGRASVPRNGYGKREVNGVVGMEEPPRLVRQLVMLARCLVGLGMSEPEGVRLAQSCAVDSMPQARRVVLEALAGGEVLSGAQVAARTGLHRSVARIALEDLSLVGVTDYPGRLDEDPPTRHDWRLGGPDAWAVREVFANLTRSVGSTLTSPTGREQKDPSHSSCHPSGEKVVALASGESVTAHAWWEVER